MSDAIHISDLVALLRGQAKVLIAIPILAMVAAVALTVLSDTTYTAVAEIALVEGIEISVENPNSPSALDRERDIQNEITLAQSDTVVAAAEAALGSDDHELVVISKANADALLFAANDLTAEGAAKIADAYANAYLEVREAAKGKAFEDTLAALELRIDDIDAELNQQGLSESAADSLIARRTELITQVTAVELARQTGAEGVAQLNRAAEVPDDPSSGSLGKNLSLALVLGIVLAFGVALVRIALENDADSSVSAK